MSLEEREGVVDRLTEKGVVLGGTWFGFSKHLKGPSLTEAHLGHKVTVLFHTYMERPYIDVVKAIGLEHPEQLQAAIPYVIPENYDRWQEVWSRVRAA